MDIRFNGKRALVTGGGRGIGRKIAQSLVLCGAKTFVMTKSTSSVESLRREDPDIDVIQVDINDWNRTREVVQSILPLDFLVNNAGIFRAATFLEVIESDINDMFSVNYKAAVNISQVVARGLIERKAPGSIVNISSVNSLKCFSGESVYGTSKSALDTLTKYMALELGSAQIRVNAVNPTVIPTEMCDYILDDTTLTNKLLADIPLGRFGEVNEVADVVLFLLSDRASLVNGVTMAVDGGNVL